MRRGPPAPALDFASWIVFEDDWLVAVDKPAGILSQGADRTTPNLVDLARTHLRRASLGVLHRLDRNVSGVVLIAKDARTAREMTALIQRHELDRVYRAIVRGNPRADAFTMNAWLAKDPDTVEVRAASEAELAKLSEPERRAFKPAVTEARVLARFRAPIGPCADLEVRPITGRSHQIRAHLADANLPIIGDPKYGVPARTLNRPLLHAASVSFTHPRTTERTTIRAPLPWTPRHLAALASAKR